MTSARAVSLGAPARLALSVMLLLGCAPALPTFSGARTTPEGRTDHGLGMASRVPTGDRAPTEGSLDLAAPAGLAPAAFARVGLNHDWDLGLIAAGPSGRLELRAHTRLSSYIRVHGGVSAFGGYASTPIDPLNSQGEGWRAGVLVPLVVTFDVLSILEAWAGLRLGAERAEGLLASSYGNAPTSAWGLRGGGVVGFALGFRRVHLLAELGVDGEWWQGESSAVRFERAGVALTPAVALRIRF